MINRASWMVSVCGVALLAGSALAQQSSPPPAPLKGPEVKDGGVPGENRKLSGGNPVGRERREAPTPQRVFMRAFDVLRGEKAPAEVRLTADQQELIESIDAEFRKEMDEFRAANGAEVRGLMKDLPEGERRRVLEMLGAPRPEGGAPEGRRPGQRRPGAKPPQGERPAEAPMDAPADGMMDAPAGERPTDEATAAARARLREIMEAAPKPADTQAAMFGVLTEAQKPVFQKELERVKAEVQQRRGPREVERNIEKDKFPGKAPGAGDKPLTLDDPRIPERVRERIKSLPPERQAEALQRLQERLRNAQPKPE
ncbi:MAG: hypothetical protein SFY69_09120 [Planctomycetota bacterium]|nr:hypothetical protein [Planctomycetota bacterium]